MVIHRPGAAKGGISTSIGNEVKQHPIASVGVAILAGLAIWALVQNKQGTDSTATPSDSFWQGYSTAQEDYLQTLSRAYYSSGANQASQPAQTPGSVDPGVSPAQGISPSTNSVFTPAYTTDITPGGMPSAQNPTIGTSHTKLPSHNTPASHPATHPPRGKPPTTHPAAKPVSVRIGHAPGRGPSRPGGSGGTSSAPPRRGVQRSGIQPGAPPPYQPITPLGL